MPQQMPYSSRDPAKFWTKNRLKEALTIVTYKLPLIVIVTPGKLYSGSSANPNMGGRESVT